MSPGQSSERAASQTSHGLLKGIASLRGWKVGIYALPIHDCYFTVMYLLIRQAYQPALVNVLGLILLLVLYFAFGVLVNDFFDRQLDIAAGKYSPKRGHTLRRGELAGILMALIVAQAVILALLNPGVGFLIVWIIALLLATAYSAPPARLRSRGFAGFLADSVIEKPLPILMVFEFFGYYGFEVWLFPIFGELLDSVFKHQLEDYDVDRKLGVNTFAVVLGKDTSTRVVRSLIHPLDAIAVVSLITTCVVMLPSARLLLIGATVLVVAGLVAFVLLERRGRVRPGFPFHDPPVVGYLNFAFRTVFLGALAFGVLFVSPSYYPMVFLVLLSVAIYLKDYLALVGDLVRYLLSGGSRAKPTLEDWRDHKPGQNKS